VDDIVTFEEYDVDMEQTLVGLGIRYNFSENALIDFHGTAYTYSDNLDLNSDYGISNLAIIYRMKF
jgi:long-subunit fatty acid transport protein